MPPHDKALTNSCIQLLDSIKYRFALTEQLLDSFKYKFAVTEQALCKAYIQTAKKMSKISTKVVVSNVSDLSNHSRLSEIVI